MRRLKTKEDTKGIGRAVKANYVNRDGNVCMYHRSDGPYEVFIAQVRSKEVIGGREYPEREVYPSNEDFGKSAWCYTERKRAEDKFKILCDGN